MAIYKYISGESSKSDATVKKYQQQLNVLRKRFHGKWAWLQEDGIYGRMTAEAVRNFQKAQNIFPVDGILGPATMKGIEKLINTAVRLPQQPVGTNTIKKESCNLEESPKAPKSANAKEAITLHFTLAELCHSDTAKSNNLDNTPNEQQKNQLLKLIKNVLEPIRLEWGKPLHINSGFRGTELNKAVGGVETSQHCKGEAADLSPIPNNPELRKKLFLLILKMINDKTLRVGQLIWEKGSSYAPAWVHVSLPYWKTNDVISIPAGSKKISKDQKTGKITIS